MQTTFTVTSVTFAWRSLLRETTNALPIEDMIHAQFVSRWVVFAYSLLYIVICLQYCSLSALVHYQAYSFSRFIGDLVTPRKYDLGPRPSAKTNFRLNSSVHQGWTDNGKNNPEQCLITT